MANMQEIAIQEIENVKIGNAQDRISGTGCTVILCEQGALAGIDVRGGGPASRETALLNPLAAAEQIHAVLLSGGSSFGLDGAGGVMQYLEERDIGFDTGFAKIPLVCASCIFDLMVGLPNMRPGRKLVYEACLNAEKNEAQEGCVGVGMGATVGKYHGIYSMMKSGLGFYAVQIGELKIGAVAVVNALGDVYDMDNGKILAGMLNEDQSGFADTEKIMFKDYHKKENLFTGNTTLGVVLTNGAFNKTELTKIAAMGQNGLARVIRPVHTMADGDSVYALSVGEVVADINTIGTLAAAVLGRAINRAVLQAEPLYDLLTASDMKKRGV
jgi:L-aminopeptidase/D-esterase